MQPAKIEPCVYLDIETTSLDPASGDLTVIGLYLDDGTEQRMIQLVGNEISAERLMEILSPVQLLYTYNGSQFDLPREDVLNLKALREKLKV